MNEPEYRKVQCSAGHWCTPVSLNDMLPRQCPVCGMPYDRRRNKPVLCFEDGSMPDEPESNESTQSAADETENNSSDTAAEKPTESSESSESSEYSAPPQSMLRRRRIMTGEPVSEPRPETAAPSPAANYRAYESESPESGIILKSGQYSIPVTEQGIYLGREEKGGEIFASDLMISRRHCFVKTNHFGEVLVTDSDSLNGTFVDDGSGRRRIGSNETASLKSGSRIYLADFAFIIEKN